MSTDGPVGATPSLDLTVELAALEAARLRRIAWRRDANTNHRQARDHGLRFRHAAKLARLQQVDTPKENGS